VVLRSMTVPGATVLTGIAVTTVPSAPPGSLERSGSFSHVEEPEAVFALVGDFTGP
jgi:hypothetical protein